MEEAFVRCFPWALRACRVPSTRVSRLRPSASFFCRFLRASFSCNFGDHVGPASRSVSVEAGVNTAVGARRRDTLKSLTRRTGQRSANSRSSLCERVHTDRCRRRSGSAQCVCYSRTNICFFPRYRRKRKEKKAGTVGMDTGFFLLAFFSALMETGLILIWIWIGLAIRWERGAEDDDARRTTLAVLVRTRNERRNACVTPCFCVTKGSAAERSQSLSLNLDMCHERQFRNDVSLAA